MMARGREAAAVMDLPGRRRGDEAVIPAVTNRDLARLAHLSEFGPGPICLSASDFDAYARFVHCGYVLWFGGFAYVTAAGREALGRWYDTQIELPRLWGV